MATDNHKSIFSVTSYIVIAIVFMTTIIGTSLAWNVFSVKEQNYELALNAARANFNKDTAVRKWGAKHGGVYVPPTKSTPPNPYLAHLPNRDVVTTQGQELTLMNPAYMIREMMDDYAELFGISGRIVGQIALNPNNIADEWESAAIDKFIAGESEEIIEETIYKGKPHLRLIRPFIMSNQGCVKCHGHLGFKLGDVRGGVGVSIPMEPYSQLSDSRVRGIIISHFIMYILGFIGIVSFALYASRNIQENRLQQRQMLEQSRFAQMGEMIGSIAHQWRQPLNALGLVVQKLNVYQEKGLLDDKTLNSNIKKSMKLINGMSDTIDDFRDFFSPLRERTLFSIAKSIKKAHSILAPILAKNSIEYKLEIDENVKIEGYGNEFSQVILNLLNNAKDALLEKEIATPIITVTVTKESSDAIISISDNAGGIDEETMIKIFDPYFTTKEEGKGTGIGLYMSKIIIEEHMNGTLSVHNTSEGACFTIKCNLGEEKF